MVDRAVRRSSQALDGVDFSQRLDERHLRLCLILLAAAVMAPLLFMAIIPGELSSLWARCVAFGLQRRLASRHGDRSVWDFPTGVWSFRGGSRLRFVSLIRDRRTPTELAWIRIIAPDAAPETATMVKFAAGDFRFELPPQQQTVLGRVLGRRWPDRTGGDCAGRPAANRPFESGLPPPAGQGAADIIRSPEKRGTSGS